jgi:glucokinase
MKSYVVGVDVGGTNIKLGVVAPNGRIIARTSFPTELFASNKTKLINALAKEIDAIIAVAGLAKKNIAGIGIGLPGLIDHKKGVVRFLPNISGWKNVPLRSILQKKTGISVYIDNDVKLITLAEWKFGAGRNCANMVCLTLGTGIGAGLIFDNKLYRGEDNAAGELGHVPLNEHGPKCNCGGIGCFEAYIGNRRLSALAGKIMGRSSVDMPEMYQLAEKGNRKALRFWDEAATHLGNGLTGVVNLLNPRLIVIGGGVSKNEKFLFNKAISVIKKRAMGLQSSVVKIKRAKFGDDAGIVGAQVLVLNAKNN